MRADEIGRGLKRLRGQAGGRAYYADYSAKPPPPDYKGHRWGLDDFCSGCGVSRASFLDGLVGPCSSPGGQP